MQSDSYKKEQTNYHIETISKAEAYASALTYFNKMVGMDRDNEKSKRMMEQALLVHEVLKTQVELKAIILSSQSFILHEDSLTMNHVAFVCPEFRKFSNDTIHTVYLYLLTGGNIKIPSDWPMLDQFYADIWGTSYIDAALDILKKKIIDYLGVEERKNMRSQGLADYYLTDSIGPGFYGMELSQIKDFFTLVDGNQIGLSCHESGMMIPQKSCVGMFLLTNQKKYFLEADCDNCLANHKNCSYCHKYVKESKTNE